MNRTQHTEPAAVTDTAEPPPKSGPAPADPTTGSGLVTAARQALEGNVVLSVLAVVAALAVVAVLIAATDSAVQTALPYFFTRPTDTLTAAGDAVGGAYSALFQGGVYDFGGTGFHPLLVSLGFATPLIAAGLGSAVAFRTGLFNIGGQGQILVSGAGAGWIGFAVHLPTGLHLLAAVGGGLAAGAIWAGVAGVIKARTGASEVILTIMLNYVAFYVLDYFLHTSLLQTPDSSNPVSPPELPTAVFPSLFGSVLNLGFLFALAAVGIAWWLLSRSTLGFRLRAVGENPDAARTAGIDVRRTVVLSMLISGLFIGLGGAYQVLGQTTTGFTTSLDAGIGFNAITVALLGRSRPGGVLAAGILFGVFQTGGYAMQASQGVSIDLVQVIQAVIVLFIAAPPLVRAIFRTPAPGTAAQRQRTKEASA
ncbi:ABC transporter permease [Streptomyces sp. NBC_01275]|uniref:ABC transporter permease n=1 Tax=Streptomyces sp. NBC_01275 TaxID=2903807 RepID=UPI0022519EA1|nr:ABC transporter permease [Streptomyces sp. NBC_01275]MCX4767941.1 ABC transporter permease [Streptomyces sp. NBC_01275]